jgi:hypothetical protein
MIRRPGHRGSSKIGRVFLTLTVLWSRCHWPHCALIIRRIIVAAPLLTSGLVALSCSGIAGGNSRVVKHQEILLVPPMNAGSAGWCMAIPPEGGCAAGRSRPPIVAESWTSGGPPTVTMGYALTTSQVLSVSISGGSSIPTRAEAALPDGLRAVVIEVRGLNPEHEQLPHFTPLNAQGERMLQSSGRGSEIRGRGLASEVPVRNVDNPARPSSGACRISQEHLVGLKSEAGSVITVVKSQVGLIGQGFLSCASTSYKLDGWPLLACVLLDAGHPGADPPPLPNMKPLAGHPGIFEAPGPEGEFVARRVNGAWLGVARAELGQRVTLLEHLHATVRLS